jgi:hypothetical protein
VSCRCPECVDPIHLLLGLPEMAVSVPVFARVDPPRLIGTPEGEYLEDDLIRMGCAGFYDKPWNISKGYAPLEILPGEPPQGDIRASPERCYQQLKTWSEVTKRSGRS